MAAPAPERKLSFVTVFFNDDVPILQLQARSMARFAPENSDVLLIYNGNERDLPGVDREKILSLYGTLRNNVRIVAADKISPTEARSLDGWRTQQALKLVAARFVENEYLVILDTKNHFIDFVAFEDFFDADLRPLQFFAHKYGNQIKWLRASLSYFGNDPDISDLRVPPTVTPYPANRSTILQMLEEIEKREGSVEKLFDRSDFAGTEFYLIFSFLQRNRTDVSFDFFSACPAPATIFSSWPQMDSDIDRVIKRAERHESKSFGLHMRRENLLSAEFWQRIEKIWTRAGILDEDACRFYLQRVVEPQDTAQKPA